MVIATYPSKRIKVMAWFFRILITKNERPRINETSDILSAATADRMQRAHPDLALLTVPGQGHAPLLRDETSIGAIMEFLARADATWTGHHTG
jgi:hypothetical protein